MTGIVEKTAVKNLAERMYAELNEILAKDLGAQRELSEKFRIVTMPSAHSWSVSRPALPVCHRMAPHIAM